MSKIITSTNEKWKGSVAIADPITIPQAQAIEATFKNVEAGEDGKVYLTALDVNKLPAVILCVEKWELENFPETVTLETFPASPRKHSHALIDFIYREILKVYTGDAEIPNE